MVADDLTSDRLVELLAAYTSVELDIHAVYPQPRQIPPKVRVFIDYLLERLRVMEACC